MAKGSTVYKEISRAADAARDDLTRMERDVSRALRELAGTAARRLAVLAERTPKVADANITWVT